MKNWFKENWFKVGLLAILIISIIGGFYWYSWRPNQIKKFCYKEAKVAEAKINALGGFIPFEVSKKNIEVEGIKNCYEEVKMKISDCFTNDQDTIQNKEDCRIKVKTETYSTCYKECLQEKGL